MSRGDIDEGKRRRKERDVQRLNAGRAAGHPGGVGGGVEQPRGEVLRVVGCRGAEQVGANDPPSDVFAALRQMPPQVRFIDRAGAEQEGGDADDGAGNARKGDDARGEIVVRVRGCGFWVHRFGVRGLDARFQKKNRQEPRHPAPNPYSTVLQSITWTYNGRRFPCQQRTILPSSSAAAPPPASTASSAPPPSAPVSKASPSSASATASSGSCRATSTHVMPLTIDAVSRIHFRGGSHLGIARANPTTDPKTARERRVRRCCGSTSRSSSRSAATTPRSRR